MGAADRVEDYGPSWHERHCRRVWDLFATERDKSLIRRAISTNSPLPVRAGQETFTMMGKVEVREGVVTIISMA